MVVATYMPLLIKKSQFEIYLEHPLEINTFIGKVLIKNESFCASSSFKRAWEHDGILKNHFIDKEEGI